MLDLTAAFSELYQVRLFDGTELNLNRPTQALQESIMRLQEMGNDAKNSSKIMKETMAIFCRVLNRNTEGITFTQEQLEDDYDYSVLLPTAIVTVKPVVEEDSEYYYFQLTDNEKLWPTANTRLPYGEKEVRAFVNYTETELPDDVDGTVYSKAVDVNWIDTILTKKPVVMDIAAEEDPDISEYGNNPVEIFNDWMTNVEDGYLTLHFYTLWGNSGIKHELNLLTGLNPDDPYEVRFTHNAHGDADYMEGDGIVAFSLKDLPDTNGETVKLTLVFDSFSGEKKAEFDYCTREDW